MAFVRHALGSPFRGAGSSAIPVEEIDLDQKLLTPEAVKLLLTIYLEARESLKRGDVILS